jgi:hypothetical protein
VRTKPPPPEPPFEPSKVHAEYRLVGTTARPGEADSMPFMIRADHEVQGYSFSVDFDEEVLQVTAVEKVFPYPTDPAGAFKRFEFNNRNRTPGNAGVDEGFIVGAEVFSFDEPITMPADADNEALRFHFLVSRGTLVPATEVRFLDGGRGSGQPVMNHITVEGSTVMPETMGSFIFVSGFISVLPEISTFVRGDSNGDEKVDVSDAVATLSWLFTGGKRPACYDAADANDDGKIEISDSLATLGFLFLGAGALPPPHPEPGEDPTEDKLGCLYARG